MNLQPICTVLLAAMSIAVLCGCLKPAKPSAKGVNSAAVAATGESHTKAENCKMAYCNEQYRQSPINLEPTDSLSRHALVFQYVPSHEIIENLGHTVKLHYKQGNRLSFDGKDYDLVQFHFHTPSEHRLQGTPFPMELHLVHQSTDSAYLVVGVLFVEGRENEFLSRFIRDIPRAEGGRKTSKNVVDLNSALPKNKGFYLYAGSLTTPPFTEGVRWIVFKEPTECAAAQINAFREIEGFNARALQALNQRIVEVVESPQK